MMVSVGARQAIKLSGLLAFGAWDEAFAQVPAPTEGDVVRRAVAWTQDQRAPYHVTEAGSRNEQSLFMSRHTRQQKKIPRFKVNNFDISSQKNGTKLG